VAVSDLSLQFFRFAQEDGVGILSLNRPPANAHDLEMLKELDRFVLETRFDDAVKAVVVTSAVPGMFSAGFDIKVLRDASPDFIGLSSQFSKEVMLRIMATRKIFIAAINGHCMGGGLEIALACDLRFCADDPKIRLGMPEVNLGLIPGEGGTQMLGRIVGKSRALHLMVTGEVLNPQRALELGLVDRLVPPDQLLAEATAYARRIAQGPTLAIGYDKLALNEGLDLPLAAAFTVERELQNQALASADAKEGARAFFEKRPPRFAGR
jgi:enoyl-CoA hydratase